MFGIDRESSLNFPCFGEVRIAIRPVIVGFFGFTAPVFSKFPEKFPQAGNFSVRL